MEIASRGGASTSRETLNRHQRMHNEQLAGYNYEGSDSELDYVSDGEVSDIELDDFNEETLRDSEGDHI